MGTSDRVTACYFRQVTATFYIFGSQRLTAIFSLKCDGDTGVVFATVLTLGTPQRSEVFSSTKISVMVHGCIFIKFFLLEQL